MKGVIQFLFKVSLVTLVGLGMVLVYLNAQLTKQFDALSFSVGATVYARPMELYVGHPLTQEALRVELAALGYRQVSERPRAGQYRIVSGNRLDLMSRGHRYADGHEPSRDLRIQIAEGQITSLTDFSGNAVAVARLDPVVLAQLSGSHADRELVRLKDVPTELVNVLIAVEDRQFWEHHGISLTGIARAAWVNLGAGRFAQGGSTITQQLIKNLYLTRDRTLSRKLIEVVYAVLLDAQYDKSHILEAYLNEVFLGQWGARAIHGFGTASRFYFGKPLGELELSEQAMLVALIKGPSALNPRQFPDRAKARRNLVLSEAAEAGVIPAKDAQQAQSRPLNVPVRPADRVGRFPAYVERVQRELRDRYSREDLISDGLQIYTAMDPVRHAAAQQGLTETLDALGQQGLDPSREAQGAVLLLDIPTGEIQAVIGGRVADGGFNRALDARRQIGSLVKPFVVASALTRQPDFHSGTLVRDDPITLSLPNGDQWSPQNYSKTHAGVVTLETLLATSINQATVHLSVAIGMDAVLDDLVSFGIPLAPGRPPASVLGVSELSPLAMAGRYQMVFNRGFEVPLRAVRAVVDPNGVVVSPKPFATRQRMPSQVAYQVDRMLIATTEVGTAQRLGQAFPGLRMAAKTGTTDDGRDAWFVAADQRTLGLAWIGFDDNRVANLSGSRAALPVLQSAYRAITRQSRVIPRPDGLRETWLNAYGVDVDADCPGARSHAVPVDSPPPISQECNAQSGQGVERSWWQQWFGG